MYKVIQVKGELIGNLNTNLHSGAKGIKNSVDINYHNFTFYTMIVALKKSDFLLIKQVLLEI